MILNEFWKNLLVFAKENLFKELKERLQNFNTSIFIISDNLRLSFIFIVLYKNYLFFKNIIKKKIHKYIIINLKFSIKKYK